MSIFERYRRNSAERKQLEIEDNANTFFQVQEYDGELWFTYNGNLVCPCTMLKDTPVDAIIKMRELYIKRNTQ